MKPFRKSRLSFLFILLLTGGVFMIAYLFLVSYVENKVEENLVDANGKSGSFRVNLFTQSLHFQHLEILPSEEIPISLRIKTLDINGVSLYALLVDKKIVINNIRADSGKLLINRPIKKPNQEDEKKNSPLKLETFIVEDLSLTNIIGEIRTDTVVNFYGILNYRASEITAEIDSGKLNYSLEEVEGTTNEIKINQNSGMYGMAIDQLHYSSVEQKITVDSLLLIPHYGKYEFAHKKGEQVARINISVPKLTIDGVSLTEIIDTAFTVSKIEIHSFDLHSFKDKRVPFLRTKHILLPMESLQEFGYPITVDSLILTDSRATIEEISEDGTESGVVTIDHIHATCGLITNQYINGVPKYAVLKASGLLMNQGEINAVFSLPLDGSPAYVTTGRISNFPFRNLNPALENLARVKIESGRLNMMKFNFRYTDFQSVGTMEIDYEDLRIIGLKKKKNGTSDFKTLVINAIVKDDKDRSLAKGKRTGPINIERDRRKYIFNVWWKSILDGMRTSILGIEKKQAPKK